MTRTIVTIGPASCTSAILESLKSAGATSFRINLSHSTKDSLEAYFQLITSCGIIPAIDTQGAQLRVEEAEIPPDLMIGEDVVVGFGRNVELSDSHKFIRLNHPEASSQADPGDTLRVDFTGLSLVLREKTSEHIWKATVASTGGATVNRAVDIINKPVNLNILTSFDEMAIDFAVKHGCKEIYASFVANAGQVKKIRALVNNSECKIISKIETALGVANAKEIISSSDEILIDRGDLSREIGIPSVPIAVSGIIDIAKELDIPVNIATNILDSMMTCKLPSRAEISDIFSLLEKGVDGFVLAAEVAIGKHPVESTALITYLISLYENHKYGLFGIAKPSKPPVELIGHELVNWL